MHEYGVSGHDRAGVGRWLGVASIIIASGLSQLFAFGASVTGWEAFAKAGATTGVVYFGLHYLFNKYIWKNGFFQIPDLNGTWNVDGQTLDAEGNMTYEWQAKLSMEQDWSKIAIHLETPKSVSNSYTATLHRRFGKKGTWLLSYSYRNEPGAENVHELSSHQGFCEIEFEPGCDGAKASYFNSGNRRTFGIMELSRG